MSYLESNYTKRNCVGKTIADISYNKDNGVTSIFFTDKTYLELSPQSTAAIILHGNEFQDLGLSITANAYYANDTVIPYDPELGD